MRYFMTLLFMLLAYAVFAQNDPKAKEILDSHDDVEVIYKRPIKRGDIGLAINEHPDIIGIIDGVFHQNSAVFYYLQHFLRPAGI